MGKKLNVALALLLVASLALTACGGVDQSQGGTAGSKCST